MMVGHEISFVIDKEEKTPGDPVLQIEDLSVKNSHGSLGLRDFSLTVRGGEIGRHRGRMTATASPSWSRRSPGCAGRRREKSS